MEDLRRLPLLVALVLIVAVVLVELGAALVVETAPASPESVPLDEIPGLGELSAEAQAEARAELANAAAQGDQPPGLGIPYLALIDGILAFTVLLIALPILVPERVQGKLQGIVTLVLSFFLVLGAIVLALLALAKLLLMVALFFAVPFGTIAYFAAFGSFDTGLATAILGLVLLLKLAASVALPVAHQRFLQNKGLVLLVLTSLLLTIVVSFLHAIVPAPLVSITDAVGALVVAIVAVVWAIVLLIGAIVSVVQAVTTPA